MGLPAKVLADDETALLVLRPHVRRLVRPALVLLVLAPAAGYAAGAVPAGAHQAAIRVVVGAVAAVVALRWVVWPFAVWWTTLYALTDERLFERAGIVRRTGHDLPLRGVTDVVVAQRFGERLLRSGTLSVTTEGGARFTMTDVPGVSRVQHGLLAVCDDVAERLAAPRRFRRRRTEDAAVAEEELGGRYLEITARPPRDAGGDEPPGHDLDQTLDHDLDDVVDHGLGDDRHEYWPGDDPDDDTDRPDRREVRRRERETARRLRALQEQVRRTPVPDSPVEDDAAPSAPAAPPAVPASDGDSSEGARILPFPPRP